MSYLTVLPHYYFGSAPSINNSTQLISSTQNQFSTRNTLVLLQNALRISLSNYQLKCPQTPSQPSKNENYRRSAKEDQQNATNSLEVVQSPQRKKEKGQLEKLNNKQASITKSQFVIEKDVRKQSQTLTEEQVQLEEREDKMKKEVPQKNRGKKIKENLLIQSVIPVPVVSLIQTAQLPEIAANTLFINNKKEELLKRQVNVWKTQVRGKKDRREVRMLGN